MKRFLLILVLFSLIALPVASAEDGGHSPEQTAENDLQFTSYPQVIINPNSNTSFNLSYAGLLLFTPNGFYYSYFPADKWSAHIVSNNSLYYISHITFHSEDSQYLSGLAKKFNISSQFLTRSIDGSETELQQSPTSTVKIWMNKTEVADPVLSNNSSVTGLQLTFTMTSSTIQGPGDLLLIQQIGAKLDNGFSEYHNLLRVSKNLTYLNASVIGVTSTNYDAYYWWNSNYSLNGATSHLNASRSTDGNIDTLIFQFEFTNGIHILSQDPYFSVPQINLFQYPIIQKDIQNAASFIILHAELLGAGLATGIVLLGITYGSFRKRKF